KNGDVISKRATGAKSQIKIAVNQMESCRNPKVTMDGNIQEKNVILFSTALWGYDYPSQHTFQLYCDKDGDGILKESERVKNAIKNIEYLVPNTDMSSPQYCTCSGDQTTPYNQQSQTDITTPSTDLAITLSDSSSGGNANYDIDGTVYAKVINIPSEAAFCQILWQKKELFGIEWLDKLAGDEESNVVPDKENYMHEYGGGTYIARATVSCYESADKKVVIKSTTDSINVDTEKPVNKIKEILYYRSDPENLAKTEIQIKLEPKDKGRDGTSGIKECTIQWGDGTSTNTGTFTLNGHMYSGAGNHKISYFCEDMAGHTGTDAVILDRTKMV
ncbi:MAG: hypothetical protein ABIH52_01385, partial [Candidatus Aenigmatarchaeota archaeon]